jgi:hypothetical protein
MSSSSNGVDEAAAVAENHAKQKLKKAVNESQRNEVTKQQQQRRALIIDHASLFNKQNEILVNLIESVHIINSCHLTLTYKMHYL